MDDKVQAIADLLQQTGQAHHQAYIETDGADDDWALWYADYLIDKLGQQLNTTFTNAALVSLLVELDHQHQRMAASQNWTQFYAKELVVRYLY